MSARTDYVPLFAISVALPIAAGLSMHAVAEAAEPPTVLLHWTFDEHDRPTGSLAASVSRRAGAEGRFETETPGPWIYDPLSRTSRENRRSAAFRDRDAAADALQFTVDLSSAGTTQAESITIEAFVRPEPQARGDAWIAGKSARGPDGAELSLQWHHVPNHGVTFFGAGLAEPHGRRQRFPTGHYTSSSRLTEEPRWRHVAVSYDAATLIVTHWVDYHLTHSVTAASHLTWDEGPLVIGGRPGGWGLSGQVDEVRVCRGVLTPPQFLRAREAPLHGVSFDSDQQVLPRDSGCLDVREHFGAVGDGQADDTAALNAAFAHCADRVPLAYNTLVIPAGEYLVSDSLYCSRFIDVKGAGSDRTIIRLKDGVFAHPEDPQPVLRMSSTRGAPGSHRATNGSSISLYLEGITIDTGRSNPGVKGMEYHSNNIGRLEDVVIRSGDGQGVLGLDLTHHDVGPALAKRVTIEGFNVGLAIRYQEYSHTLEHLTLRGQRVAGIRNQGNILAIRGLHSDNSVPAVVCEGANSMLSLVDAVLAGGAEEAAAITSPGGLYCLRVKTAGYGRAIARRRLDPTSGELREESISGPDVDEYVAERVTSGFGERRGSLRLPIEETPSPDVPPVAAWVNVLTFAHRRQGDDWSPVVQAAVDSGARVVYIPCGAPLRLQSPIRLRAPLERIVGLGQKLQWDPQAWKRPERFEQTDSTTAPPPLLIYDEANPAHILVLDRLECSHVQHASPATLVLRSSSPERYSTGSAGGRLFAEDVGGADWHFDHPQNVWVRQWNPESHAPGPCIHMRGGRLWALGFKTEYESQKLLIEQGAEAEILGAFIYPLGPIPEDRPVFESRDSALAVVYGTSVYSSNHRVHIRDRRGGVSREILHDDLMQAGSRFRMDLYVSDGRERAD